MARRVLQSNHCTRLLASLPACLSPGDKWRTAVTKKEKVTWLASQKPLSALASLCLFSPFYGHGAVGAAGVCGGAGPRDGGAACSAGQ